MRILIIGGTGFIGPHVVHELVAGGHEVVVFHRGQTTAALPAAVRMVTGDRQRLPDQKAGFQKLRPDVVIDMIPYTEQDALALTATFRGIAGRLVAISSGDVYRAYGIFIRLEQGPLEPLPITEDSCLRQVHFPYRASSRPGDWKYDYEKILVEHALQAETSLPATVLRLPMVYGPGDKQHRLRPYLLHMVDGRKQIPLNEGMARWRCPRGYVKDMAGAVFLAATHPAAIGRTYNVAEATAYTEAEWVHRVGAMVGWGGAIVTAPNEQLPVPFNTAQDFEMDSTRIRSELGYRATVDCDTALRDTVEWERLQIAQNSENVGSRAT